jgi:predicted ribonuclease YlaK
VQRKGTKRKHTPLARRAEYARFPPLLAQPGAAQLAEREQRASGSNTCSLKSSRLSCGARRARTGPDKQTIRRNTLRYSALRGLLIIDEAQNLTTHQMKTLITRSGPGSKVVCLGNIAQIDTPYLTETTSGLTYVADRFKHWEHSGHATLQRGERSRLADYASEIL